MNTDQLTILSIQGIKEVECGDSIGALLKAAVPANGESIIDGDVVVVAQKIVSKSEGCVRDLSQVVPSSLAVSWARRWDKDPRLVEVVLSQSARVVRMDRGVLITETRHGYICANAGVDTSNVEPGKVTFLPEDPDRSAAAIREEIGSLLGVKVAVILSDTFGRPWREGLVNVALGVAGLNPMWDYRGTPDSYGRLLTTTQIAVADELASAAEIVMGKGRGIPAALIRGVPMRENQGTGRQLLRSQKFDLFR